MTSAAHTRKKGLGIDLKAQVSGRYTLKVTRPDGTVRESLEFDNLITDAGIDNFATTGNHTKHCFVGSGNTAPAATDTALVNQIAESNQAVNAGIGNVFTDDPTNNQGYQYFRKTYRFDAGVAQGVLAEIGTGDTPGTSLTSRALIRDGNGNPTTITVLADEILDVTFEVRMYYPDFSTGDVTGQITLDGQLYDYTIRQDQPQSSPLASSVVPYSQWGHVSLFQNGNALFDDFLPASWEDAINTGPNGNSDDWGELTEPAYVPGSGELVGVYTCGINDGNFSAPGDLRTVVATVSWGRFAAEFKLVSDPTQGIQKDNTKELTITWTYSYARRP